MLDQLQGFHVEPTNICTLKCPRCARTQFIEQFGQKKWHNKNLNLSDLKNFLDIDLTDKSFNLCGNYGDPIYYTDIIDLVAWIKSQSARLTLITNGSYRSESWWQHLCRLLDSKDEIVFSIDGTPENFVKYRLNADWTSIKTGIDVAVQSQAKTIWKYIPFNFNENDIERMRDYSCELGIDNFKIEYSDRWNGEQDPLKPIQSQGPREHSKIMWLDKQQSPIDPRCKKQNNQHFISAEGYYMPCCYVGDHRFYYKSEFYKNQDTYDISKTTLTEVLFNLQNFYNTLEENRPSYCTFNCPKL